MYRSMGVWRRPSSTGWGGPPRRPVCWSWRCGWSCWTTSTSCSAPTPARHCAASSATPTPTPANPWMPRKRGSPSRPRPTRESPIRHCRSESRKPPSRPSTSRSWKPTWTTCTSASPQSTTSSTKPRTALLNSLTAPANCAPPPPSCPTVPRIWPPAPPSRHRRPAGQPDHRGDRRPAVSRDRRHRVPAPGRRMHRDRGVLPSPDPAGRPVQHRRRQDRQRQVDGPRQRGQGPRRRPGPRHRRPQGRERQRGTGRPVRCSRRGYR